MSPVRVPAALRRQLGDQASEDVLDMIYDAGKEWRDDVWERSIERFERRLSEGISGVRVEIASSSAEILRWSFLFWITQLAAMAGLLAYMK